MFVRYTLMTTYHSYNGFGFVVHVHHEVVAGRPLKLSHTWVLTRTATSSQCLDYRLVVGRYNVVYSSYDEPHQINSTISTWCTPKPKAIIIHAQPQILNITTHHHAQRKVLLITLFLDEWIDFSFPHSSN